MEILSYMRAILVLGMMLLTAAAGLQFLGAVLFAALYLSIELLFRLADVTLSVYFWLKSLRMRGGKQA